MQYKNNSRLFRDYKWMSLQFFPVSVNINTCIYKLLLLHIYITYLLNFNDNGTLLYKIVNKIDLTG